jgi:hypothetical protein
MRNEGEYENKRMLASEKEVLFLLTLSLHTVRCTTIGLRALARLVWEAVGDLRMAERSE